MSMGKHLGFWHCHEDVLLVSKLVDCTGRQAAHPKGLKTANRPCLPQLTYPLSCMTKKHAVTSKAGGASSHV